MVNATTETVSRLLAKFEREGQARSTRDGIWWRSAPVVAKPRPSSPAHAAHSGPPSHTAIVAPVAPASVRQGMGTG